MLYTTTISDASVYGITAAREAYNAALPSDDPARIASDSAYIDFVLERAIQSWCVQYAPVVAPIVPIAQVASVPQSVSFRQAKQELIVRGWWAPILAAVDAIADPVQRELMRTEVLDSQVYERQRPELLAMAKGVLHLTDTQIDELFVEAAKR